MSKIAKIALVSYILQRIISYVMQPRPYLWWHGLIDLVLISIMVLAVVLYHAEENYL